ncbi:helix-turn-helix domain-containing protein [Desulfonatronum lacustre]|uniref:helix-turn-helix domain-containing protein n=1 Tax=Desulfonatronum lacustre TaxID=66849 RepID=UPI00048E296E|nr:helix-turn-helix domain-containing protein [Desulfonatronum lacustre]
MDLKEFGRLLQEERLRQGLEIADVMDKTKISRMNLMAIEEGNEQALPHPVYAKGFVKNYARFLGMDADKMGNTLAQIYVSKDESDYDDLVLADAEKLPAVREGWPRFVGIVVGVLLLLALIGSGVWFFKDDIRGLFSSDAPEDVSSVSTGRPGSEPFLGPAPHGEPFAREGDLGIGTEPGSLAFPSLAEEPISETPEDAGLPELESQTIEDAIPDRPVPETGPRTPSVAEPPQETPQETPSATPPGTTPESPPTPDPAPASTPESTGETAQTGALPQERRPEEARVAQEPALTPAGVEKTLEIRATENCWLSAQADGARPREAFLRPGERFVITFENTLEVRLGNAGGVVLYMDGNPWPFSARSGEVMSLRFP